MSALPNFFGGADREVCEALQSAIGTDISEAESAECEPNEDPLNQSLPGDQWTAGVALNAASPRAHNRGNAWRQKAQVRDKGIQASVVQNAAKKLFQENERVRRFRKECAPAAQISNEDLCLSSANLALPQMLQDVGGSMLQDAGADAEGAADVDDLDFEQFKSPDDTWQGAKNTPAYFLAQQKRRTSMLGELPPLPTAFKPDCGLPTAYAPRATPTQPKVKLLGDTVLQLQWQNGSADPSDVLGYRVVMHEEGRGIPQGGRHSDRTSHSEETELQISGLVPGSQVKFKIATLYSDGKTSPLSDASTLIQLPTVNQQMQVQVLTLVQPGTELGELVNNFVDGTFGLIEEDAYCAANVTSHFKDTISAQIADADCADLGGDGHLRQQWDGIVATEGLSELDDDEVQQRYLNEIISILESQVFGALEQQLYEAFRGQCLQADRKVTSAIANLSSSSYDFWMIKPKFLKAMKWDAVISALDKLSSTSRRREMVQSMMDALQAICEGVGGGEGADAIFPALLYAIAHSKARTLVATLMFLGRTLPESQQYGQEACYLTTMSAAVNYLHDRSWPAELPAVHAEVQPDDQVDLFYQDE